MKIIQITDLHLDDGTEDTRGVDVRSNFSRMMDSLREEQMDHLVVTGDLCLNEGRKATYEWIKEHLDQLDVEYSVISGNHDDNELIKEVFNPISIGKDKIYYSHRMLTDHLFFLDTSDGVLDQYQMDWMNQIYDRSMERLIVFMHHPPIICDVPFMDSRHGMNNQEETQAFFEQFEIPIYVFCGHFHVDKYIAQSNLHVFVTPSNYFQMGQKLESFEKDHDHIGYRRIELGANGLLRTDTHYVYSNRH